MDLSTNQTAGGDKTFSGATTTFQNNVQIDGDLNVDGTIASVSDLEVDDNVITVNKNGTDVTSEDSGLQVERVGTDGKIGYQDSLEMKFKAGPLGSENELQGIVKDTEANILAIGSPLTSVRYYATDTGNSFFYDANASQFKQVGSGEGGGGGLDTFNTQDFEDTGFTNNSSGNNASFLGGGTLDGTFSLETSSPISKSQSWKYVAGSSSLNDYLEVEVIDLDLKQRDTDIKVRFSADMTNMPVNATFVCYDKTNSAVLSSTLDILEASQARAFYEFAFYVPSTCAQISWGIHFNVSAPGSLDEVLIDDAEWTTNPFISQDLNNVTAWSEPVFMNAQLQVIGTTTQPNTTVLNDSANTHSIRWRRVGENLEMRLEHEIKDDLSAVNPGGENTGTTGTQDKDYLIELPEGLSFASHVEFNQGDVIGPTTIDMKEATRISWGNGYYYLSGDLWGEVKILPWDATRFRILFTIFNTIRPWAHDNYGMNEDSPTFSCDVSVPIDGWTTGDRHIVTPAKSNMTDWVNDGASTITGVTSNPTKGTNVRDNVYYRRVGDSMEVRFEYEQSGAGATGSGEYLLEIPNGLTIDTSSVHANTGGVLESIVGNCHLSNTSVGVNDASRHGVVKVYDSTNVVLMLKNTSTEVFGSWGSGAFDLSNASIVATATFTVPIEEWSSDVSFLAAVPVQKVAYVQARTGDTGQVMTTSFGTLNFSTLAESGNFLSLSSNQITVPAGEYVFDITVLYEQAASSFGALYTKLVVDPSGTPVDYYGLPGFVNTTNYSQCRIFEKLTFTETTTLEVQGRKSGGGDVRFGTLVSAPNDLGGIITVTKLR
jgi:hypothetical protein